MVASPMPDHAPWLAHYDRDVPASLAPYPEHTILDSLATHVRERPSAPAILFKGARITYADLDRDSDAFAAALLDLGVNRGDRVALLLPNAPQFMVAQFGAWKVGAI